MKNPKLLFAAIALVVLGVGIPYAVKNYRLNQMTETDLFSMGQVVANKGDCGKALDYYQTLLKKDPRHTVAMDFMAGCQARLKDLSGAIATLEKRNALEPQPKSLTVLGDLYEQAGEKDRAELTRAKVKSIISDREVQAQVQATAQLQQRQRLQQQQSKRDATLGSHSPAGKAGTAPAPKAGH